MRNAHPPTRLCGRPCLTHCASALFRSLGNGPRNFLYYHTPQVNATTICRRCEIWGGSRGGPRGTGVVGHGWSPGDGGCGSHKSPRPKCFPKCSVERRHLAPVLQGAYVPLRETELDFVLRTMCSNISQTLLAPFHFATLTQNISLNH